MTKRIVLELVVCTMFVALAVMMLIWFDSHIAAYTVDPCEAFWKCVFAVVYGMWCTKEVFPAA